MNVKKQLDQATLGSDTSAVALPPTFDSTAEARQYIKQRVAAAYRIFAHFGFDDGLAGHITARDPQHRDRFWVNPVGLYFGKMRASDLLCVDHDGQIVEGRGLVNRAAFAIHSRIHAARPDVTAIAHAHTRFGRAFSVLGRPLAPITQDACVFYENHAIYRTFSGVVEDVAEGDAIAQALGNNAAAILQNHGTLTVGTSVDAAAALFVSLERCCETQLLAEAAGTITAIPHDIATKTRQFNGSELVLWGNFQPLYQMILDRDPSFLD
ncbi:MAG: class II aldolase/adducin family protein [Proteobacteria bacterium]|nr:class II aldolase/adducin family protein [Pseudomonadota bacterium]